MHEIAVSHGIADQFFADDAQLYTAFRPSNSGIDQESAFSRLSLSIDEQGGWLQENRLKLNADKTDALLISTKDDVKKMRISSIPLVVGDASIIPSAVVRNLGVLLDNHLTMEPQISSICRKAYFHLRRIASIKRFLSLSAIKQLVCVFVLSLLDYGNALLVGLPASRLNKLQRVQNSAARLILDISRRESISSALCRLHWLPVDHRIRYKIAVTTFCCLIGVAPKYLSDLIHRPSHRRTSRSASQLLLVPTRTKKSAGDRAFVSASANVWNSLPHDLRLIPILPYSNSYSLKLFKTGLKTFLFRDAYVN